VMSSLASEKVLMVPLGDPLVNDLFDAEGTFGQSLTARGFASCPFCVIDEGELFGVADEGEGLQCGKGKETILLWACKGKLEKLEKEVDQALLSVLEGLEESGPFQKPNIPKPSVRMKGVKLWAPNASPSLSPSLRPMLPF
jgi:hypothetical protein